MIIIATAISSTDSAIRSNGAYAFVARRADGVLTRQAVSTGILSPDELSDRALLGALLWAEDVTDDEVSIVSKHIHSTNLYNNALGAGDKLPLLTPLWRDIHDVKRRLGPRVKIIIPSPLCFCDDLFEIAEELANQTTRNCELMRLSTSGTRETKTVYAKFNVPADMDNEEVELAINLRFQSSNSNASVSDSSDEF